LPSLREGSNNAPHLSPAGSLAPSVVTVAPFNRS
jgi:hypothetical protein